MIEPIEDWAERHLFGWREPYDPQTFNGRIRRLRCECLRALENRAEKGTGLIRGRGRSFVNCALVVAALVGFVAGATRTVHAGNASFVDPFIGTAAGAQSYAKGNVFPGAVVPHGMVAVSPDTNPRYAGGYQSGAAHIEGFSQNHLSGLGCAGDMGNILLQPTVGAITTTEATYRSTYNAELADVGYYKAFLSTPGVTAEVSATTRASFSKFTFPARSGDANIIVDVSHGLTPSRGGSVDIVSSTEVEGYNDTGGKCNLSSIQYKVYFVARFSKASVARGTWTGATAGTATSRTGSDIGAYFRFSTTANEVIFVRLGLSYVSIANARANLNAEIPNSKTFDTVRADALAKWDSALGRINVVGGTTTDKIIFYTALYHALIHPSVFSDVNGEYQGMEGAGVKTASGYTRYHVFPMWDSYRALHPLLALIFPEQQIDMVKSLIGMYQDTGWLPRSEFAGQGINNMTGDPATIVIADTYLKGLTGFDIATAYTAMKKNATTVTGNPIRQCLSQYQSLGYVPEDACQFGVSITQEYAYADHALAQLAQARGLTTDYNTFHARSLSYKNMFDSATGFLRPKNSSGTWYTPFDPLCCAVGGGKYEGPGFKEGTAWQYLFMVPGDISGLRTLLGGDAAYIGKINTAFTNAGGYYTLINEPDMLYPYLYTFSGGNQWRTAERVRADYGNNFDATRSGLPGNDDAGQTSSRLVFDMMGLYPLDPIGQKYRIGSPIFTSITLTLNTAYYAGSQFVVQATNSSPTNKYVQSATLNGRAQTRAYIFHNNITAGGTLGLMMGTTAVGWNIQ